MQHLGLGWYGSERRLTNDYANPPGTLCSEDGIVKSEGRFDDSLPATFSAGLAVLIVPQRSTSDGSCAGQTLDVRTEPEFTMLTIEQLALPDGVLIEGDDWRVHIWADPR